MAEIDLSDKIERMAALEERIGITLSGLYAFIENDEIEDDDENRSIKIYGDLKTRNEQTLPHNVRLIATVYDSSDRIIGAKDYDFLEEDFFCIETFGMTIDILKGSISKIRIYSNKNWYVVLFFLIHLLLILLREFFLI